MRFIARVAACLVFAASVAHAGWPAGGTYVMLSGDSFNGLRGMRFLDLPSGDLVVVGVGKGGTSNGYTLQRISPLGEIATGWPVNGLQLGQVSSASTPLMHGYAVDDSECVWHDVIGIFPVPSSTPSAQIAVRGSTVLGPWAAVSGANSNSYSGRSMAAAPAPGGAYFGWSSKLQRFTRGRVPA